MKILKTVDEKLADIGFVKLNENKYGVDYERKDNKFNYTQVVSIGHKRSGRHILQSYDKNMKDEYGGGNTCVGLTGYEMKLFLKKMKQIGLYSKKQMED